MIEHSGVMFPDCAEKIAVYDFHKWEVQRGALMIAIEHVKDFGSAIDGGAYVGQWSNIMTQHFSKVYAVEPVEGNRDCIKINAPCADILPFSISDVTGTENYALGVAGFGKIRASGEFETQSMRIDDLDYDGLGLIKLDVEGREEAALKGGENTIEKHRPIIITEYKWGRKEIDAWMKAHGYKQIQEFHKDMIWGPE